jgi:alpha,alpha-trehalase
MNIMWSGLATKEQAEKIEKSLSRLEFKYGIAACEPENRKYTYQWDYPNGWANLQFITIKALDKYGYREDARRVAAKYVNTIAEIFRKSNKLYEKYNVVDGTLNVSSEYGAPTMMGWTAGVFVFAEEFLKNQQ